MFHDMFRRWVSIDYNTIYSRKLATLHLFGHIYHNAKHTSTISGKELHFGSNTMISQNIRHGDNLDISAPIIACVYRCKFGNEDLEHCNISLSFTAVVAYLHPRIHKYT